MASHITNAGADGLTGGTINWASDTIKARLCKAGTPNKDDTAMTGHTAVAGSTDLTLASKTRTKDTTNDRIVFGCANLTFAASGETGSATHIYIYKDGADDASRIPIFNIDITDQPMTGVTSAGYTVPGTGVGYLQQ